MAKELYDRLGEAKCEELAKRSWSFWNLLGLSESRKSAQARGIVHEGIARDFIREYLPPGFGLMSGLIFDAHNSRMSPHIDAIVYKGVPLLDFTDVAVVEKEQVKAIFEIKSWIAQNDIVGSKSKDIRNPNTGLAYEFNQRRDFLPAEVNISYLLLRCILVRAMLKCLKV